MSCACFETDTPGARMSCACFETDTSGTKMSSAWLQSRRAANQPTHPSLPSPSQQQQQSSKFRGDGTMLQKQQAASRLWYHFAPSAAKQQAASRQWYHAAKQQPCCSISCKAASRSAAMLPFRGDAGRGGEEGGGVCVPFSGPHFEPEELAKRLICILSALVVWATFFGSIDH